jgi:hypothetical protein
MAKQIKVLVNNDTPSYSSESLVVVGTGNKYKIVAENGNCYTHLNVYKYTHNGIDQIACGYDIPNYKKVNYVWDDDQRMRGNMSNILAAEKYVLKID